MSFRTGINLFLGLITFPMLMSAQTVLILDQTTSLGQNPETTLRCQIDLDGPCELSIVVTGWENTLNWSFDYDRIYIYNSSMESIDGSVEDPYLWHMLSNPDTLITRVGQAGTYYIDFHSGSMYGWPEGQTAQAYTVLASRTLVVDNYEPNESIVAATPINLDQTIQASQWRYTPTNMVWGDEDFYTLTTPSPGILSFELVNWGSLYASAQDYDRMYIYDAVGNPVGAGGDNPYYAAMMGSDTANITINLTSGGQYFPRFHAGGVYQVNQYSLKPSFQAVDDQFEPNDEISTAGLINFGTTYDAYQWRSTGVGNEVSGDEDYYKLFIPETGTIEVAVSNWVSTYAWAQDYDRMYCYNENGIAVGASGDDPYFDYMFDGSTGSVAVSSGGVYYIHLHSGVGVSPDPYQITFEFIPSTIEEESTSLVAHYPFTGNADDVNEENFNAIAYGGVDFTGLNRFGNPGSIASFDGIDDYIVCPNMIPGNSAFTLSLWVNPEQNQQNNVAIIDGNHIGTTNWVFQSLDGANTWRIGGSGYDHELSLIPNKWTHIVWTRSDTLSRLFIDSQLASDLVTSPIEYANFQIFIGKTGNWERHFNGSIDDIRLHDTELTEAEIQTLYQLGNWPPEPDAPQNLIVTSGYQQIILDWSASTAIDFEKYLIYRDVVSPALTLIDSVIGDVEDASYIDTDVSDETTYYYRISTVDVDGYESDFSNEVSSETRLIQIQNLDIGDSDDLQHLVDHTPLISFDYFDSHDENMVEYHLHLSTDSAFGNIDIWDSGIISRGESSIEYAGGNLLDGQSYFLRLKAGDGTVWSEWTLLSFQMNSLMIIPELTSPLEATVVEASPILTVAGGSDPDGDDLQYIFSVYSDIDLLTKVDSSGFLSVGEAPVSWQVTDPLADNTQYFWTVFASDSYEMSSMSGARSFVVNSENNVPEPFALLYPQVDAETGVLPTFTWASAVDPDPLDTLRYTLYLDTPEPGTITLDMGLEITFTYFEPLEDNTAYYWKVVAQDRMGFEVNNIGGYQPFVTNTANDIPSIVDLISPDSVIVLTLMPEFYWTMAQDQDLNDTLHYEVQWWNVNNSVLDSALTDTNNVQVTIPLEDNSQYRWQVLVMDNAGGISQSAQATFWTDLVSEAPSGFVLSSPINEVAGLSQTPSFVWETSSDPDPLDIVTYSLKIASDSNMVNLIFEHTGLYSPGFSLELANQLVNDAEYWWKVIASDSDSLMTESEIFKFTVGYVSIIENMSLPNEFVLQQNYPNPFNPSTTLSYGLPEDANVSLIIYDIRGESVKTIDSGTQVAGWYKHVWNGLDNLGQPVSTGLYLTRLQAGSYSKVIKMLYIK